jgi:hypothetical protein
VKKSIQFFFTSFRRKPESSVFKVLRTYWTPVFTGVTAENQFFHSFGGQGGFLELSGCKNQLFGRDFADLGCHFSVAVIFPLEVIRVNPHSSASH